MKVLGLLFAVAMTAVAVRANADSLGVHGPKRIGLKTDRPFLYLIPASGQTPLTYSVVGLPQGLKLDAKTGVIDGSVSKDGSYPARLIAQDATGASAFRDVEFVVGAKALALTPVMGWNPWYVWGCRINDATVRQAADFLVSTGLAAHGYNYINLDDCWQGQRDAGGDMVPNARFPDMTALAAYVHSKGLRIGIYTSPGPKTCAGYPGTEDHNFDKGKSYLEKDVATYSRWGFDFIKYDWCIFPKDPAVKDYYMKRQETLYRRMSDALDRAPRAMVHMICQYGYNDVWTWGERAGGNMWRTNNDLADEWPSVLRNGFDNVALTSHAGPGHWNDLDMLMVGKANWPDHLGQYDIPDRPPRPTKLTYDEQVTHISLWSLMASPLLFSGDLSQLDTETIALLTNDDVIDVDQDSLGAPVVQVEEANGTRILSRRMADGSIVVGLFNLNDAPARMRAEFAKFGFADKAADVKVRDLWKKTEVTARAFVQSTVPAHGTTLLKLQAAH